MRTWRPLPQRERERESRQVQGLSVSAHVNLGPYSPQITFGPFMHFLWNFVSHLVTFFRATIFIDTSQNALFLNFILINFKNIFPKIPELQQQTKTKNYDKNENQPNINTNTNLTLNYVDVVVHSNFW